MDTEVFNYFVMYIDKGKRNELLSIAQKKSGHIFVELRGLLVQISC